MDKIKLKNFSISSGPYEGNLSKLASCFYCHDKHYHIVEYGELHKIEKDFIGFKKRAFSVMKERIKDFLINGYNENEKNRHKQYSVKGIC